MRFVKNLFGSQPRPEFRDPVLGTLNWSEEEDGWLAPIPADTTVQFLIAGDQQPDAALLAHAQDINSGYPAFQDMVGEALMSESAKFDSSYANEIRSLRLEMICLFWPDRPNDGMLYLRGGRDYRVWRFNYVDRRPAGLGFDS